MFNTVFEHFNESIINLLESKIKESQIKQTSIKELKSKVSSPKEDFSLYLDRETIEFIDDTIDKQVFLKNPVVILTLNKEQAHKILKRYYFKYLNNKLSKDLSENMYEKNSFLLSNETAFYVAKKILKDEDLINYIEIGDLEIENRLKIINNQEISNLIKKDTTLITLKKVYLILSEDCNLHCTYCYEQKENNQVMTLETAKEVLRKIPNGSTVCLFGGEPFLHINLMKQIMNWGYEFKNFDFEISTNGQTIDKRFFKMYCKNVKYIQISVDGPEYIHDLNRGKGSWKKAMQFYETFHEETGWYPTLFRVISKNSIPYLFETIKWFYNMESKAMRDSDKNKNNFFPWRGTFGDFELLEENDFIELEKQWTMIKDWYLKEEIYKSHWSILAFNQAEKQHIDSEKFFVREDVIERLLCPAGKNSVYVNTNGDMVSCFQDYGFLDENKKSFSTIKLEDDFDRISPLGTIHPEDVVQCKNCDGYGCLRCIEHRHFYNNSIDQKYCRANKVLVDITKKYIVELKQKLCI